MYREISKPFASIDEANTAVTAFFEAVYELRKVHGIPDVHVIAPLGWIAEDGEEASTMVTYHIGDPARAEGLTAYAYGFATAEHDALVARMLAGGKRVKRKPPATAAAAGA